MGDEDIVGTPEDGVDDGRTELDRFMDYLKENPEEDNEGFEEEPAEEVEEEGEEEEEGEVEGEGQEQPAEPSEPVELDVDDFERPVTLPDGNKATVKELVQGYFRQKDYTQKTQALAEQRKQFDGFVQQFAEGYASTISFVQALQQRPYIAKAFRLISQGELEAAQEVMEQGNLIAGNAAFSPLPDPLPAQTQTAMRDPRVDSLLEAQNQKELERLDSQWAAIRERRPDLAPDPLLNELLDHQKMKGKITPNEVDLEEAYRELYWDYELKKAKQEGQKRATRNIKKGATSPTSMRQSKPAAAPSPIQEGMTDVEKAAARYSQMMSED
jgi:hypothetical protein